MVDLEKYRVWWVNPSKERVQELAEFIKESLDEDLVTCAPMIRRPVKGISHDHGREFEDEWVEVSVWIRTKHEEAK
jgi:hypothetical protein